MVKRKLASVNSMLGTFILNNNPDIISIISRNLDFVILDREHGSSNLETLNVNLNTIDSKCLKFVRVSSCDRVEIQKCLELDPDGILVPQIENEQELKNAINFSFFKPIGIRGISPYTKAFDFHHDSSDKKKLNINNKLKLCILAEGPNILKDFDKMIPKYKEHIHMVYFGLFDFANSTGLQANWGNKLLLTKIKKLINICKRNKIKIGTIARTKGEIKKLKNLKIDYIVYQNDTGIISEAFNQLSKL